MKHVNFPPRILTAFLLSFASYVSVWVFKEIDDLGKSLKDTKIGPFELSLKNPQALSWIFAFYGALWFTFASLELKSHWDNLEQVPRAFFFLAVGAALGLIFGSLKAVKRKVSPFVVLSLAPYVQVALFLLIMSSNKFFLSKIPFAFGNMASDLTDAPLWHLLGLILMTLCSSIYLHRTGLFARYQRVFDILFLGAICFLGYFLQNLSLSFELGSLLFFLPALALALVLGSVSEVHLGAGIERAVKLSLLWHLLINFTLFFYLGFRGKIPYGSGWYPVLNALDAFQILYILVAIISFRKCETELFKKLGTRTLVPVLGFLWLNCLSMRVAVKFFHEDVHLASFWLYPYFNGILAIIWAAAGLTLIFLGKSLRSRGHWFLGATLLGLDLVKLFVIDLRNSPTLLRILAFLLVGAALMLIGWIAPIPPREKNGAKSV
jgi:hypothetical protein